MRLRRSFPVNGEPLALAIGNFDGVHLGHQAILAATRRAATRLQASAAAMTFSPLPREYFAKHAKHATYANHANHTNHGGEPVQAPSRLMSVTEKLAAFSNAGIEQSLVLRFDAAFASQSPESFLQALKRSNVRWLMVGEDFRFGAKRAGDIHALRAFGQQHGITVETLSDVTTPSGQRISSSAIREALRDGQLVAATAMLGRPYAIVGRVTHGKKLGRTLGFATANVALTGRKPALSGVFAVKCRLVTRGLEGVAELGKCEVGQILDGVANLGTNPVVSTENRQHLEVFLFDFSGDLYGKRVQVSFIEKIRDERNFASKDPLGELVTQMHDDTARAKAILSRMKDERPK